MTSDSMSTRPRISAPRISPDAPGLRAMPSTADDTALPCASAPKAAAMASAKPAVMNSHCSDEPVAAPAAAPCAYAGDVNPANRATVDRARILRTVELLE